MFRIFVSVAVQMSSEGISTRNEINDDWIAKYRAALDRAPGEPAQARELNTFFDRVIGAMMTAVGSVSGKWRQFLAQ